MLGRTHDSATIGKTFQHLRDAGFRQHQLRSDCRVCRDKRLKAGNVIFDEPLELRPEHLSLYLLDVHEGTPLARSNQPRHAARGLTKISRLKCTRA